MTLEEQIKQMLDKATVTEAKQEAIAEEKKTETEVKTDVSKTPVKESSEVSSQVAALLEAEGLSDEFKVQAVTIFEAAVTDRVLQITEELEAQYQAKLDEAVAEVESNIDGFLNEAIEEWQNKNEVAIQSHFRTQIAESFMDGLQALLAEHSIDLPVGQEDALDVALDQVSSLEESLSAKDDEVSQLQEQINSLKAQAILESFRGKMAATEYDRFIQLVESVKYADEAQYTKQLQVVMENFSKIKAPASTSVAPVTEDVVKAKAEVITESTTKASPVSVYAEYLRNMKI